MEAPKIIWLSPNEYRSNEPSCFWSESQRTDYDIEYIRTDAFMEKARRWFEEQNEWLDLDGNRQCDMESFEDFKKYIEE